jgi:hypothetical protein
LDRTGRENSTLAITANIEDLAVTEFMMMLAHNQKTGQFTIERGDDRVMLAFRDGTIVYATSTGVRETVGAMLVRRELIDDDQLQEALQRQQRTEEVALLGQILVEMEAVETEDLIQVVYLQFQNVVREALSWSQGHAEFTSMVIPDLGNVRVDPREIILEEGIVTERLLLGGAVEHDEATGRTEQTDQPDGLRATLSKMQENSLAITAEMAAAILDGAQDLVCRGVLFAVYEDALGIVGGFEVSGGSSSLTKAGHRLARLLGEDSVFAWVIDEGRSYRGRLRDGEGNRPLRELLGEGEPEEVIAIPVIVDGRVAAVFYGDNGIDGGPIGHTGDLERVVTAVAREMGDRRDGTTL